MKKHVFVAIAALAAAVIAAPASAQFYLGAGVGGSKLNHMNGTSTTSGGVSYNVNGADQNKTSWKFLAGYQFTKNWGMEVQYTDLGSRNSSVAFGPPVNAQGTTNSASAKQWGIAGIGVLPLENNFYLMGKLGASFNSMDTYSVTVGGATATSSNSDKTDVLAGVGVGYNINKNVGLRLEYEYFGKFSSNSSGIASNVKGENFSLNLMYAF